MLVFLPISAFHHLYREFTYLYYLLLQNGGFESNYLG